MVLRAVGFLAAGFFAVDFLAGDFAALLAVVFGLAAGFFASGLSGVGAVVALLLRVGRGCLSGRPSQTGGWPSVYGTGCCAWCGCSGTGDDVQLLDHRAAEAVLRKHAADGLLDHPFGLGRPASVS